MASLLRRIEQAGLASHIMTAGLPLNRWRAAGSAIDDRLHLAVAEAQTKLARAARIRGAGESLAGAVGDSCVAAGERPIGVNQLGHPPRPRGLGRQMADPLSDPLAASAAGH